MPNSAQISIVTKPAVASGISVSSMSAEPPEHQPQQDRDRDQRQHARLDEGAEHRPRRLQDRHRPFGRVGLDGEHGLARTCAWRRCRWGRALGAIETRARPSGGHPIGDEIRRQIFARHLLARERRLQRREVALERRDEHFVGRAPRISGPPWRGPTAPAASAWRPRRRRRDFPWRRRRAARRPRSARRHCPCRSAAPARWRDRRRRRAPWRPRRSAAAACPDRRE